MTVGELIKSLEELDPTLPVVVVGLSRPVHLADVCYEADWVAVELEVEG